MFRCTVYSVEAGKVYNFKADGYALKGSYPSVIFTTTNVITNNTYLANGDILYSATATPRNVDFIFACTMNGYVVIAWISDNAELKMYETVKTSHIDSLEEISDFSNNLHNKTIAVLGDSIMMLMRTNYSGTNTVNYLGSDGNTYAYEQLTNINGKLYVTADNSISCTIVNSNQDKLDIQNWEALKNKTGASDVINCGLGGATVSEKSIITEFPYPDDDNRTNCLSNEVKMLNRLVQNGRTSPDCILIWLGTNNATADFGTDNFEEVMQIDYNTLADDSQGRTYRQSFYGGLRYSLETLCREYPYATIFIFTPVQTRAGTRNYSRLEAIGKALKKMTDRYSCICVNALTDIGIVDLLEPPSGGGTFLYDGLHPNTNGKKLFANFTAKKLNQLYFSKK